MTAIGDFISNLNLWTLVSGALLGAIGLGLRTIMQEPVKAFAEQSRVIAAIYWISRQRPFSGLWEVTWHVDSARFPPENTDQVYVRRLFSNITFTTTAVLLDGSTERCVFIGKLVDKTVTGRWYNPFDQGRTYYGAFQFRLHAGLRRADGSWIGWRNDGTVQAQEMSLKRID